MEDQISKEISTLLAYLSEDPSLTPEQRGTLAEVREYMVSAFWRDIVDTFIQIVYALRNRIDSRDLQYFASEQFAKAIRDRIPEFAGVKNQKQLKVITPMIDGALDGIRSKILANGNKRSIDYVMDTMARILKHIRTIHNL